MKITLRSTTTFLVASLLLLFFSYLMLEITLQYLPWRTDVAFLQLKQEELKLFYYESAFFIHVFTSMFALLAGFTQFSKAFRINYPKAHRTIGVIYVSVILFFSGPSGLIMGYHANGGFSSQLAFVLLAIIWIYSTWKAFDEARSKNFDAHRAWMIRSYALTLSAVTLRAWKWSIVQIWHPSPMDVYRLVAWLGWVLNLVVAELYLRLPEYFIRQHRG